MNLHEQMNDDLDLFLDADGPGESCQFLPRGQEPGFPAVVLRGDGIPSSGGDLVQASTATPRFLLRLSVVHAGILLREGQARDPGPGDQLRFSSHTATVSGWEPEADASDAVWIYTSIATLTTFSTGRTAG